MKKNNLIFKVFNTKYEQNVLFLKKYLIKLSSIIGIVAVSLLTLLWSSQQAIAHHAMGGKLPTNFVEGFASGLGHPIIGLDHFAFVVASGLIAAGQTRGILIPIAFVVTAMLGTGLHLLQINLPVPEMIIASSVIAFGAILAIENSRPHQFKLSPLVLIGLAAIAGIFHGYAYGESIVGAQTSTLVAYLIGFTSIQSLIALVGLAVGNLILKGLNDRPSSIMRFLGLAIGAIGIVFFASSLKI